MDGIWSESKKMKIEKREIPIPDKDAVNLINRPAHWSAAQLIQTVYSCLSHFIGATSHTRPANPGNRVKQWRLLVKGSGGRGSI